MGATRHIVNEEDAKLGITWAKQEENKFMNYV